MKHSTRSILSLAIGLLGLVWCLAIWVVAGRFLVLCTGGILCGVLAVVLALVYLTLFWSAPGRGGAEAGALSLWLTLAYVAAVLFSSTMLILRGLGGLNRILLFAFAAITAVYLILILSAEKSAHRLSRQSDLMEQKLAGPLHISAKLGELLSITQEGPVRTRLLKLKEAVDYSSNRTTSLTAESERQMVRQLEELLQLLSQGGEPAAVQDALRQAELTWSTRTSAASSMR